MIKYSVIFNNEEKPPKKILNDGLGIIWKAEFFAEQKKFKFLFDFVSFVAAFVGKWDPYEYQKILRNYVKKQKLTSDDLEKIRRCYEF